MSKITVDVKVMENPGAERVVDAALANSELQFVLIVEPIQAAIRAYLAEYGFLPNLWIEVWAELGA